MSVLEEQVSAAEEVVHLVGVGEGWPVEIPEGNRSFWGRGRSATPQEGVYDEDCDEVRAAGAALNLCGSAWLSARPRLRQGRLCL